MKPLSTGWKLPVLIGILVIVASLINVFFFNKAAARREAKAQEQREAAMAVEAKQAADKLAKEKKEADEARQQTLKAAEAKHIKEEADAKARAEATEAKRIQDEADAKAQADAVRKKAIEEAAAEHARFLARYLNSGFARKPGVAAVAITIESEQGTVNPNLANALTQRFQTRDVQLLNSFFKPEFVADRFVANIFSGDTGILDKLELTNSLDGVLVGRETVTYSTNAVLENTVTASLRLEVIVLPVGSTRESQSWILSANGAGLTQSDARMQAEEHISRQISNNATMSLSGFSTNK